MRARPSYAVSILTAIALLSIVGAAFALGRVEPYAEAGSIVEGVTDFDDITARFESLAREKGAVYAFGVLQRTHFPGNIDLHLLGHSVGDILYDQKGIDGIAYCTQDFRNACSHSIVIGTLNEFSASAEALRLIDDACKKAPGGSGAYTMCYHGLGHGVFAFFGYDLPSTVAFCKKMGTPEYHDEQYTQCVGGAVMELMGGGAHDHDKWLVAREKYLPSSDPLAPCNSDMVSIEAKVFCYSYLTPRLYELVGIQLGSPDPALFPKAFAYCDTISTRDIRLRDACFGGFGKEFIPMVGGLDIRRIDSYSDEQFAEVGRLCELAGVEDGTIACITQALASVFWGGENNPAASFRYCSAVPSAYGGACLDSLAENIGRYLSGPDRQHWCDAVPKEHQTKCAQNSSV